MRFLKQRNLSHRIPNDTTLYSDVTNTNVIVAPTNAGSLILPRGTDAQVPGSPVNGMMRYNTDHNEVQVYQSNAWRNLRFKEPTGIVQQNLGAGDGDEVYFGPLSPAPVSTAQSGVTWNTAQMAKNLMVIVENVIQLAGTNYVVVQDPGIPAEILTLTTSAAASSGNTTIYLNTALQCTGGSVSGGNVTLAFSTRPAAPFADGSSIVVTGFTPIAFNGTFTVTACTTSSVTYVNSTGASGAATYAGQASSTVAAYPTVNFAASRITGNASVPANTTISSFATDADTDALVSITINNALTGSISANSSVTSTESSLAASGYYLQFSSPPPYGKIVTVLSGFDT